MIMKKPALWIASSLVLFCMLAIPSQAGPAFRSAADYASPGSLTGGIQEAIESLPKGGGTVYVPEGTYLLGRPIKLKPNTKLIGAGKATVLKKNAAFQVMLAEDAQRNQNYVVVADASKLKKGMAIAIGNEGQGAHIWGELFLITGLEGNKVSINHILSGGGLRNDLSLAKKACAMNLFMNILPSSDCIISDLEIDGNADEQMLELAGKYFAYGMLLGGVYPLNSATKVERCWIHDSGYDGIQVNGRDTKCTILNCNIYDNRGNGIHGGGGPETICSQCNIYGNKGSGFYFCFGNCKLIITSNLIYRNGQGIGGINAGDLERDTTADRYSIISNNIIFENQYAGITSRFGPDAIGPRDFIITGNIVKDNNQSRNRIIANDAPAGIVLQNAQRCIVTNNRCFDDQDGFPRSLVADAKRGDSIIKTTDRGVLRADSPVCISDKNHSEVQMVGSIGPSKGGCEIKLKGKLAHSYQVAEGACATGTKSQQWGIICYWWGSKKTSYDNPALCKSNIISNNLCDGNATGGILWSGVDNLVSNNMCKVEKIDEKQAFEQSLYPAQGKMEIPNAGFENDDWWRLGKQASYDTKVAHSGKRSLKLVKTEEKGATDTVSQYFILKPNTRYRLSAWVRSKIEKEGRTVLPYLFLYSKTTQIGNATQLPFEPIRDMYSFSPQPGQWAYVRAEAFAGPEPVEVRIYCRLAYATGEGWVDDVVLEELEDLAQPAGQSSRFFASGSE